MTQIFYKGQPSRDGDRKTLEVMTSTYLKIIFIQYHIYLSHNIIRYAVPEIHLGIKKGCYNIEIQSF